MFWKMLFKDLKSDKGMNLVLFVFMIVASTLMVISSIVIMAYLMPKSRSAQICKTADVMIRYRVADCKREEYTGKLREFFSDMECLDHFTEASAISLISPNQIDVEGFDEESLDMFFERAYSIEYQEFEQNLLFDIDDKPFVVEGNGIAVSEEFRDITGVNVGGVIYISTDSGKVFRFVVTTIYKEIKFENVMPLVVSRDAFNLLLEESNYETLKFSFFIKDHYPQDDFWAKYTEGLKNENYRYYLKWSGYALSEGDETLTEDNVMMYIIIVFCLLSAVFMIAIILMTIRFTLVNAIENEKKELGMMKAIGADTMEFRLLFAAKYIGFALVSGCIALFAGIPLSKIVLKLTYKRHIFPTLLEEVLISVFAIAIIILVMIIFTVIVLRKINKISVMEVIHGQGKGESFGKISMFHIYKSKLSIPFYLALSDIRYKFKKYVFLIGAYVCAFLIILCTTNLRDSVYDISFSRYMLMYQLDFYPDFNEELTDYYWAKTGSSYEMMMMINEDLKAAGIPAGYELAVASDAYLYDQDEQLKYINILSEYDAEKYIYREGQAPKLRNEIALSYANARKCGLKIGDKVTIEYRDRSNPMVAGDEITEEFIITAFFDYFEGYDNPLAIASNEFHNGLGAYIYTINVKIDAPEEEKPYYLSKIYELFGEENIDNIDEYLKKYMGQYDTIFTTIRNLLSGTALLVIMLITLLYGRILIASETTEIAALKSTGFTEESIKCWQYTRGVCLLLISTVIAYAIHVTLGQGFVSVAFHALGLTGFKYIYEPIKTFIVIPCLVWGCVLLVLWFVQKNIKRIQIWKIRED